MSIRKQSLIQLLTAIATNVTITRCFNQTGSWNHKLLFIQVLCPTNNMPSSHVLPINALNNVVISNINKTEISNPKSSSIELCKMQDAIRTKTDAFGEPDRCNLRILPD